MSSYLSTTLAALAQQRDAGDPLAGITFAFRFESDKIAGIVDGDPVSTWRDTSGNGRDATQTGSLRPTWHTNVLNGEPVVRFTRTQGMVTPSISALSQPNTIFVVCKSPSTGLGDNIYDGLTSGDRHALFLNSSGNYSMYAGSTVQNLGAGSSSFRIHHHEWNGASSKYAVDGGAGTAVGSTVGTNAITGITLGNRYTIGSEGFASDMAALFVIPGVLSTSDLDLVGNYLANKYALTWNNAISFNAASPQTTPTYDGSGELVHPSLEYFPAGWNGWKYWLCITPYPASNDDFENPSILVSNDGASWEVPAGLTNPIVAFPGGSSYNADGDLVWDEANGLLWCVYLETAAPTETIKAKSSSDGVTWSSAVTLVSSTTEGLLSPAVSWDGSQWVMYTIDYKAATNVLRRRTASAINGTWSTGSTCTMAVSGRNLWHVEVVRDGDGWHALLCTSSDDNGNAARLHLARSTDGTTWRVGGVVITAASSGAWDDQLIYRGAMLPPADGVYRVWYSARKATNVWRQGYTEIPDTYAPTI